MAGVGLIESLLTLNIVDEITETRGRSNKEAVAQGTANILSGLFSGMGGCAMIGQSLINTSNGARARLCGIVAALMLLAFIMFGAPLIEKGTYGCTYRTHDAWWPSELLNGPVCAPSAECPNLMSWS